MTPPNYNQEIESNNAKDIEKIEDALSKLTLAVTNLTLMVTKNISEQSVRCDAANRMLARHNDILMGDGDSKPGMHTKIATLSLQTNLIMVILGTVSATTLGLTANMLIKAL